MKRLHGVYTYIIPESITQGIANVRLHQITEDPVSYINYPYAEKVNFLIARQGAVNAILQKFPNIKWIQLLNAGYEKVDLNLLKERNIIFTNARSVYCNTIAEDVIAKILIMAKNYLTHIDNQKKHFWPNDFQLPNENVDIAGKILGIMGAGAIGSEVANRAKALHMTVYGYDPYLATQKNFDKIYNDPAEMAKFLGESDFIITSLPVNEETRNIINAAVFASMKPTAFLLNVARGEVIDEDALVDALNRGVIRGAAIDVAREEPLPAESPLWTAKNILITPHRAAYGDVMWERMCQLIEANVHRYMNQEPLLDQVIL